MEAFGDKKNLLYYILPKISVFFSSLSCSGSYATCHALQNMIVKVIIDYLPRISTKVKAYDATARIARL